MRACSDGCEMADPRHAEVMVERIGVKDGRGDMTPGVPDRSDEVEHVAQKVEGKGPHQLQGTMLPHFEKLQPAQLLGP